MSLMIKNKKSTYKCFTSLFRVERGARNIHLRFYSTLPQSALIHIKDSKSKLRGQVFQSHTIMEEIFISQNVEESSYHAKTGKILEGDWKIEIYPLEEMEGFESNTGIKYDVNVKIENKNTGKEMKKGIQSTNKKWYRGDFHSHTIYSDGKMAPEENNESARAMDLDFYFATDHNIYPYSWPETEILVLPSIELTTRKGHCNVFFAKENPMEKIAFSKLWMEEDMNAIIEKLSQEALVSINHPMRGGERWQFTEIDFDNVFSMEILNNPTSEYSKKSQDQARVLFDELLLNGYKILAIGGGDNHKRPEERNPEVFGPERIGDPSTYVFAENLSAEGLLEGMKKGHVYVSRIGEIDFKVNGKIPGEKIYTKDLVVECSLKEEANILLNINGKIVEECLGTDCTFHYELEKKPAFVRLDIRDKEGLLIGYTNPVFYGEFNKGKNFDEIRKEISLFV